MRGRHHLSRGGHFLIWLGRGHGGVCLRLLLACPHHVVQRDHFAIVSGEALAQLLNTLRNSPQFMAALPGLIAALLNSGRAAVEGAEQGVERAGEQARTATMEAASALCERARERTIVTAEASTLASRA